MSIADCALVGLLFVIMLPIAAVFITLASFEAACMVIRYLISAYDRLGW